MKRRDDIGTFSITSPGISERVEESSSSFGAAVSKAQRRTHMIHRILTGHWPAWIRKYGKPYKYRCIECGGTRTF